MKNHITISTLSPELQKAIRKEVSTLKTQAQKKPLSEDAKAFLDRVVAGTWTQREDGKIDVKGSVYLKKSSLTMRILGKEIFFGKVSRDVKCWDNNLSTLEGYPEEVGGKFYCYDDNLESLEGAPKKVGGDHGYLRGFDYVWNDNQTSLKGAPVYVGRDFDGRNNNLTSLEGIGEVKGKIYSDLKS
jgi:hypothetical protein